MVFCEGQAGLWQAHFLQTVILILISARFSFFAQLALILRELSV
jgi:hypothetical protein